MQRYTWMLFLSLLLISVPVAAQSSKKKKSTTPTSAHTQDDSRTVAMASARKTPDPFGFLKGGDQHKKNKDCACPGTKKGERQRRKEMRNHRKRK